MRSADMTSNFYMSFPAKTAEYSDARRRGFFCQLEQYCGLAFVPACALHIHERDGERALFVWEDKHVQRLKQIRFNGIPDADIISRQLHFVGYLCELAYDLCLAPDMNVSRSPGFETPLGIFGGNNSSE